MTEHKNRKMRFNLAMEKNDLAIQAECYLEEAIEYEQRGEIDAACFNFTHAHILALDGGAKTIWQRALKALKRYGRE